VITVALVKLLGVVSAAYDRATGVGPAKRRRDSWVSVERKSYERPTLSTLERILVVVVAMAAIAFEIWFFFFSTSPIDQRTGRSAIPLAQSGQLEVALRRNAVRGDRPDLLPALRHLRDQADVAAASEHG
jgi:hypothetical protein